MSQLEHRQLLFFDGSLYTGTCLPGQNVPHGCGTAEGTSRKYVGGYERGQCSGNGILTMYPACPFPGSMYRYEGSFKANQIHGVGTAWYHPASGGATHYYGGWDMGRWSGYGILIYANGDQYSGGFRDGLLEGYGVITRADGSQYAGGMNDQKPYGYGRAILVDGTVYEGGWKEGMVTGNIVCTSDGIPSVWCQGQKYSSPLPGVCPISLPTPPPSVYYV